MENKSFVRSVLLIIAIILVFNVCENKAKASIKADSKKNFAILVDLTEERLYLIDKDKNEIIKKYSIASGKIETPSPIGTWRVIGMAKWSGGFGTRWIGLNVPWGTFGIHGTNKPGSIGSEASHGCIRMLNKDVEDLYEYVRIGMTVAIYGGPYGGFEKGFVTLKPGDRGAAVLEVQRKMKDKGYYPGNPDGIYGEGMKRYVMEFKEDHELTVNNNIDYEFYKKLGIILMD